MSDKYSNSKCFFTTSGNYEDFENIIFVANLIIVKLSLDVTTNDLPHTYTSFSHGSKPTISRIKKQSYNRSYKRQVKNTSQSNILFKKKCTKSNGNIINFESVCFISIFFMI